MYLLSRDRVYQNAFGIINSWEKALFLGISSFSTDIQFNIKTKVFTKDRDKVWYSKFVFRIHASATADKERKRGSSGTVVKSVLVEERPLHTSKPNYLESQEQDNKPNEQTEVEDKTTLPEKARD